MGVRVYELARTLGRSSKDLMHELKKQGIDLKSHMSSIDEETAELVADVAEGSRRNPRSRIRRWHHQWLKKTRTEEENLEESLSISSTAVTAETIDSQCP